MCTDIKPEVRNMWTRINIRGVTIYYFLPSMEKRCCPVSFSRTRDRHVMYKIIREEGKSKVDLVFLFSFISHKQRREIIDRMNKTRARWNPVLFQHFSPQSRRSEVTAEYTIQLT